MRPFLTIAIVGILAAPLSAQQRGEQLRALWQERRAEATTESVDLEDQARSITYMEDGQEITRYFSLEETDEGLLQLFETETPGGKTLSRSKLAERPGRQSAQVTNTGPQGNNAATEAQWLMSELGFEVSKETVEPNGETLTQDSIRSRTDDGVESTTTHTGPESNSATSTTGYSQTDDGVNANRLVIGPDGQTYTLNTDYWKSDEGVNREGTSTGPGGQQVTSKDTWVRTGDGWSREGTKTTPWGIDQRERTGTVGGNTATIQGTREWSGYRQVTPHSSDEDEEPAIEPRRTPNRERSANRGDNQRSGSHWSRGRE